VRKVDEKRDTPELKTEQLAREREERRRAQTAPEDGETAQHERRADKAAYLRHRLEERAESERKAGRSAERKADQDS
jgi:hypothetical protein